MYFGCTLCNDIALHLSYIDIYSMVMKCTCIIKTSRQILWLWCNTFATSHRVPDDQPMLTQSVRLLQVPPIYSLLLIYFCAWSTLPLQRNHVLYNLKNKASQTGLLLFTPMSIHQQCLDHMHIMAGPKNSEMSSPNQAVHAN